MMHIILVGKFQDVKAELEKMLRLQQATGHVLMKYQPDMPGKNEERNNNLGGLE